jgi:hypothetical protein
MALTQISKILNRTGNLADLPQLAPGELGWASDSRRLFIGNEAKDGANAVPDNTEILTISSTPAAAGNDGDIQLSINGQLGVANGFNYNYTSNSLTIPTLHLTDTTDAATSAINATTASICYAT